jgi:hypothetical protein
MVALARWEAAVLRRAVVTLLWLLTSILTWSAAAQPSTCPDVVSRVLDAVGDACGEIGRNEICYGNLNLSAVPRNPSASLDFSSPGDRVGIGDLAALSLAGLAPALPEWGIAIVSLQANIPSLLPGQNATIVLFGDISIEDVGGPTPPMPDVYVIGDGAPVHQEPAVSATTVGAISREPQRVVGRLADGSWLRVALDDGTDGWVYTAAIAAEGDALALPVTAPDIAPPDGRYGPMQAFRLQTGIGAPSCDEAPRDGILIQTPDGARAVQFQVNGVDIALGSTAAVRAAPGEAMRIALLEGQASFAVPGGGSGVIRAAEVGIFTLDANGMATGEFTVEGYSGDDVAALPVVLLPRVIRVRTPEEIAVARAEAVREGRWRLRVDEANSLQGCVSVLAHELEITLERIDDVTLIEHSPIQDTTFELQPDASWVFTTTDTNLGRHTTTTTLRFDAESGEGKRVFTSIRPDLTTCDITVALRYEFLGD